MVDGTETNGEWLGDSAQQAVAEGGEHEGLGAAAASAVDGGTDAVGGEGAVKKRPWTNVEVMNKKLIDEFVAAVAAGEIPNPMARYEDELINGDGSFEPSGIMNSIEGLDEGAVKEKPWTNLGAGVGTKVRGFSQRTERKRGKR